MTTWPIKSRAHARRVEEMLKQLAVADAALCAACLTNVLTKTGDQRLRNQIDALRSFRRSAIAAHDGDEPSPLPTKDRTGAPE